jgi:hypothetical protein
MQQRKISEDITAFRTLVEWRRAYLPLGIPSISREDKYAGKPEELGTALGNKSVAGLKIKPLKKMTEA